MIALGCLMMRTVPFAALIVTGNVAAAEVDAPPVCGWLAEPHAATAASAAAAVSAARRRERARMIIFILRDRYGGRSASVANPGRGTGTNRPSSEDRSST